MQKRILAWVKACELRIALVKNCRKMFVYFPFDGLFLHLLWRNFCFAAESCSCWYLAVLLLFTRLLWNLKNWWLLVSLCFESALPFGVVCELDDCARVKIFSTFSKRLNFLRLLNLFLHYVGVQICLMKEKFLWYCHNITTVESGYCKSRLFAW